MLDIIGYDIAASIYINPKGLSLQSSSETDILLKLTLLLTGFGPNHSPP